MAIINVTIDEININETNKNFIDFSISEALTLNKDDIKLYLNDILVTLFDLYKTDSRNYRLVLSKDLLPSDYMNLSISNTNFNSLPITILMSQYFDNHSSDFTSITPSNFKGKIKFALLKLAESEFLLESSPITVSLPLDKAKCSATLNGTSPFVIATPITVSVTLYDINNEPVPDGIYVVELLATPTVN
jgi:hypothetical protein